MEVKTATAWLSIEVNVDCPHCESLINLLDSEDTSGYSHNDEGYVLRQACPDGCWSEEHKKFEVDEVRCSECGETFNVRELDW